MYLCTLGTHDLTSLRLNSLICKIGMFHIFFNLIRLLYTGGLEQYMTPGSHGGDNYDGDDEDSLNQRLGMCG